MATDDTACSTDASDSYYEDFEYNGYRYIITNGLPDHDSEENNLADDHTLNPNRRCK